MNCTRYDDTLFDEYYCFTDNKINHYIEQGVYMWNIN